MSLASPYLVTVNDATYVQLIAGIPPEGAIAVPEYIEKSDYPYLRTELVFDEDINQTVMKVIVDQLAKAAGQAFAIVEREMSSLYAQYSSDLDSQMRSLFGTTDQIRGLFLYMTWQRMETHPADYSAEGLLDDDGNVLDTDEKVLSYAQSKIATAKDYSVFVLKRIAQLQADINGL